MNVARSQDARAQTRKVHSSPYARPQSSKRWTITKFFEPLRRVFSHSADDEHDEIRRSLSPADRTLHDEPSYIGVDDSQSDAPEPPRSPSKTVSPKRPVPREGLSPHATLENVVDFLTDASGTSLKRDEAHHLVSLIHRGIPHEQTVTTTLIQSVGRPLGAVEVEGMISLIRKQSPYERPEPFRFQTPTPSRDNSPFSHSSAEGITPSATPKRKTLSKNPNGQYRWQGAGSAKQTTRLNRFSSPALKGTPKLVKSASEGDVAIGEGKRRKTDEDSSVLFGSSSSALAPKTTQAPTSKLPFPISSSSSSQNSRAAANGTVAPAPQARVSSPSPPPTTPSRLRTTNLLKPTTPSHPSPLRQAWTGNSPNTSQEDLTQLDQSQSEVPSPPKPTTAASLMSELIKEVTPAKKPDLSNPYQTASPLAKVGPPRRSTRRTRANAKAAAESNAEEAPAQPKPVEKVETDKPKDPAPENIFEATVPKGSKRSRPPGQSERPTSQERRSPSPAINDEQPEDMYVVEEVEDDSRANKKRKDVNGAASTSRTSDIEVEELDSTTAKDASIPSSSSLFGNTAPASTSNGLGQKPAFTGFKPMATAPSRPSKLRFSYQPEASVPSSPSSNSEEAGPTSSATMEMDAPPPPTLTTSFSMPIIPGKAPTPSLAKAKSHNDVVAGSKGLDPKAKVLAMPISELPTFVFTVPPKATTGNMEARRQAQHRSAGTLPTFDFSREALKAGPSKPAVNGFNWAAAGLTPQAPSSSEWTCSDCTLKSPNDKNKCIVCDAPRPGSSAPTPPTQSFNWGAAGLKPPTASSSEWTCPTCDVRSPNDKNKCISCETTRPGSSTAPAAPVQSFNWAASGFKPPTASTSEWTCSLCSVKTPNDQNKCMACETPRS